MKGRSKTEINGQTKLADILAEYPFMKTGMVEINGKFKMLQTPMGKMMAKKATVADMSERSGMLMERFGEQNPDVGVQ